MEQSLRGYFLIAGPKLRDPNFFKTVVLIVEHGPEGAMGLVINRPSSMKLTQALTGHLELPDSPDLVYVGGPVEPNALFVIHNCPNLDPDERPVIPGVYMGSSAEVFEDVVCDGPDGPHRLKYRVYSGCSGWGPGQLEGELEQGDWLTLPAECAFVYRADPYAVWDELVARAFEAKRILPQECRNPEWN